MQDISTVFVCFIYCSCLDGEHQMMAYSFVGVEFLLEAYVKF